MMVKKRGKGAMGGEATMRQEQKVFSQVPFPAEPIDNRRNSGRHNRDGHCGERGQRIPAADVRNHHHQHHYRRRLYHHDMKS